MAYEVVSVVIFLVLLLPSASSDQGGASGDGGGGSIDITGSISCPDCTSHDQLAGFRVVIKCGQAKQVIGTLTDKTGSFKVSLPSNLLHAAAPCYAMLVSRSQRPCKLKEGHNVARLTISSSSCTGEQGFEPVDKQGSTELGGSKTVDLPLPPEWGLPPTSYYTYPIIPIGIP